ncbi:MAG: metal-dependent transcriptional regulator [Nitrososphaerota archaeon]|nr:metal-dependent transcriptional regulator [Nitrososphaerota archaeon]MDG6938918.1 metal-dependent transcriptional regulator [Nitrososphaerota archaeon]MDG6981792.1 metal-dependent transcriptional regulator [Nitrososphaerota archaeon]
MTRLTRRERECLISVYELSADGWPARVRDISDQMKVKPPTAVGFLERLSAVLMVERGAAGYRLSAKGREMIDGIMRSHRIFETFLTGIGVALQEACRIASEVDMHIEPPTINALCAHIGHPSECPHGRKIPGGDDLDTERR